VDGSKWSEEELNTLREHYDSDNIDLVTNMLPNRTRKSVMHKAIELGLVRKDFWTAEEISILEMYNGNNIDEITELLTKRTKRAVMGKIGEIGLIFKNRWTEEEIETLKENYDPNDTDLMLELLPGRTKRSIYVQASRLNLTNGWTEEEIETVKENYGKLTNKDLQKLLPNRTLRAIQHTGKETLGIDKETFERRYKINEDFFSTYTLESCYWAGFIAADGAVSKTRKINDPDRLRINLQERDKCQLEKFAKVLDYTGPINEYEVKEQQILDNTKRTEAKKAVNITVCSKKLVEDLRKNFNITEKKSLTLEPPKLPNRECELSFIKGYLDGDGSLPNNIDGSIMICINGTYKLLNWIKKIFDEESPGNKYGTASEVRKDGNIYKYSVHSQRAAKIINILINLETSALNRKWSKYMYMKDNK